MQTVLPDTFDNFESDAPAPVPVADVAVSSPAATSAGSTDDTAPGPQSDRSADKLAGVQSELSTAQEDTPSQQRTDSQSDTRERNPDGTFKTAPVEEAKPKVKAAKPRIDQLTWEREEARREAAAARADADRYRTELEAARKPAPKAEPTDPEPNPADIVKYPEGQYDRAFIKDQARWEARQEFAQQQQVARQRYQLEQRERAIAQRVGTFTERIDAAKLTDADVLTRVSAEILNLKPSHALGDGERPSAQTAIADALLDSEIPTGLMLHLTEHPDIYRRLTTLHPIQVIREIGKLEARLDPASPGAGSQPPISQAKRPITPVGSAPSASDEVDLSQDADLDTHVRVMNAREKKPLPRRY